MLINITKDKGIIRLNMEFASAVPEFADVLNDEKLGTTALAYVIYSLDVADDNLYQHLPEEIRKVTVAEDLKLDKSVLKDAKVLAALKKYRFFVDNNVGYQFKSAYNSGMRKISEYVDKKKTLDDDSAKEFGEVMKQMPAILKGKGEIEKVGVKEASKGMVRGQK